MMVLYLCFFIIWFSYTESSTIGLYPVFVAVSVVIIVYFANIYMVVSHIVTSVVKLYTYIDK